MFFGVAFFGIVSITPNELLKNEISNEKLIIFWQLRVPRVLLAAIVGAGLSLSGLVTQAILRNPLATPYTLGISGGSAFGAMLAIKLGLDITFLGFSPIIIFAFLGSIITAGIIYIFAMSSHKISTYVLILAGVTISYFLGAVNLFIQFISDFTETRQMVRWMMGGLETIGYSDIFGLAFPALSSMILISFYAKDLNILSLGDDLALSKGVDVSASVKGLFILVSITVATVVSFAGPIGFVGLIIPHFLRLWMGPDNRYLIPASVLGGAVFLMISDTLARLILAPTELPVGVLTAILGGPGFILMLLKKRREIVWGP